MCCARAPVLTVNGSDDGFDGFRIGLAGFDNPMRDPRTEEAKRLIGQVLMWKKMSKNNTYLGVWNCCFIKFKLTLSMVVH